MSIRRTTVVMSQDDYNFLLRLAGQRWGYSPEGVIDALKRGERPGISAVLRELIQRERRAAEGRVA